MPEPIRKPFVASAVTKRLPYNLNETLVNYLKKHYPHRLPAEETKTLQAEPSPIPPQLPPDKKKYLPHELKPPVPEPTEPLGPIPMVEGRAATPVSQEKETETEPFEGHPIPKLTERDVRNFFQEEVSTIRYDTNLTPEERKAGLDKITEEMKHILDIGLAVPEEVEPLPSIPSRAKVAVGALTRVPDQVVVAVLQAIHAYAGSSVTNRDWAETLVKDQSIEYAEFVQSVAEEYSDQTPGNRRFMTELASMGPNIAYTITTMAPMVPAALAAGLLAALPGGGALALTALGAGTAASGALAYRMTTYQIAQQYLEVKNADKLATTGKGLTVAEERKLKTEFHGLARRYGLWEAVPEAVSNLIFLPLVGVGILGGPLTKMLGKSLSTRVLSRVSALYGQELITETITQKMQSRVEVEAGLREGHISVVEAFQEVAPSVLLLTTLMGGAGSAIVSTPTAMRKIKKRLKKTVPEDSQLYKDLTDGAREILRQGPEKDMVAKPFDSPTPVSKTLHRDIDPEAISVYERLRENTVKGLETSPNHPVLLAQRGEAEAFLATQGKGNIEVAKEHIQRARQSWETQRGGRKLSPRGEESYQPHYRLFPPSMEAAIVKAEQELKRADPQLGQREQNRIKRLQESPGPTETNQEIDVLLGRSEDKFEGVQLADLQDSDSVVEIATKQTMVRQWVNNLPEIRWLYKLIDPSAVATTSPEKYVIGRAVLLNEAKQKAQGAIAHLHVAGSQKEVFGATNNAGVIKKGVLKGMTVGDIAKNRGEWESKLTVKMQDFLNRAKHLEDSIIDFLKRHNIEIHKLDIDEGGQFAARQVFGRVDKSGELIKIGLVRGTHPGSKLPQEHTRIFETEQEAIKEGFIYMPYEDVLHLRILGAYRRVADEKMANWLIQRVPWRSTGASEEVILADVQARRKLDHSKKLADALNRAVRGERIHPKTINAIASSYPKQAKQLKSLIPRLQRGEETAPAVITLTRVAKGMIKTNQRTYQRTQKARTLAAQNASKASFEEAYIGDRAPAFSGVVFTQKEARETADVLMKYIDPSFSTFLGEVNKFNAVFRFFKLAGDHSAPLIQLILLMAHPKTWSGALLGGLRAILSEDSTAKLIEEKKDVIDRHPNLIVTAFEVTEAMEGNGLLSGKRQLIPQQESALKNMGLLIPRTVGKIGGITLTPFHRAYGFAMTYAGLSLAESLEHLAKTPQDIADIDQHINLIRGLTSTARIGVSLRQRQVETFTIMTAQYLRATVALLADTSLRGGVRGRLARSAMIKGLGALVVVSVVISLLRGESKEEILDHLNPTSPNFVTWEVAGQKLGFGSKFRSIFRLVAQTAADPESITQLAMENPGLRALRGNLSPVLGNAVNLITGQNFIGDPTRDDAISFTEEIIISNLLPIWVESVLMDGGTLGGRIVRGAAEFFGARAYPEPIWDEINRAREEYAKEDYGVEYSDLNKEQKDRLYSNHPDLQELDDKAGLERAEKGTEFEKWITTTAALIKKERDEQLEINAQSLNRHEISKYTYDKERSYAKPYYSGGMAVLWLARATLSPGVIETIEKWNEENLKEEDKVLNDYLELRQNLIQTSELPRNWEEVERKLEVFLSLYPPIVRDYVLRNQHRWINSLPPEAQAVEFKRLSEIEDGTWWDDYREVP